MRAPSTLLAAALLLALTLACSTALASSSSSSSRSTPPIPAESSLVSVQVVSRHGTRAPNPVVDALCPTERDNLARYSDMRLTLAGLTGTGQRELYALGVFARQTYMERGYPHFLPPYFNDEQVYFRAVGEERTIQSAVCMGHGMYPAGSAAVGYFSDLPSPVPVYTLPDELDSLLEVRKKGCAKRLAADAAEWDRTEGVKLYREHVPLLKRLLDICNITDLNEQVVGTGDNYGDAIKDITDALTFDMLEGFPSQPGLNYSSLLEFRTLAVEQLLGRILGTEEQVTYLNGQLPEHLVRNFHSSVSNQGPKNGVHGSPTGKQMKMWAYHGHREMLYALGAFLGIEFDIDFPGLPKGAIPPGTTLFFELHYHGERDAEGNIPDAYESHGMPNPWRHRRVRPEEMPPKQPAWGAPLDANEKDGQQAQAKDAKKKSKHARRLLGLDAVQTPPPAATTEPTPPASASPTTGSGSGNVNRTHVPIRVHHMNKTELAGQPQQQGEQQPNGKQGRDPLTAEPSGHGEDELNDDPSLHRESGGRRSVHRPARSLNDTSGRAAPAEGEETEEQLAARILPRAASPKPSANLVPIPLDHIPPPPVDGYTVRAFVWHPCAEPEGKEALDRSRLESKANGRREADCPAVAVKMRHICDEYECSLADFQSRMEQRVRKTGTWDQLCGVTPAAKEVNAQLDLSRRRVHLADAQAANAAAAEAASNDRSRLSSLALVLCAVLLLLLPLSWVVLRRIVGRNASSSSREEEIEAGRAERQPLRAFY